MKDNKQLKAIPFFCCHTTITFYDILNGFGGYCF